MATDTDTVARTTRRRHYWQLPTFALGVAAVCLAYSQFPPAPASPERRHARNVKALRAALERKPLDAAAAENLAATVGAEPGADADALLLAGTATLAGAEQSPAEADRWARAAALFARIDPTALASLDDRKRLAFRAAKVQAATGQGDAAALALALCDVPQGDDVEGERRRLLSDCYLRQAPPALAKARDELAAYLSSSVRLTAAVTAQHKQGLAELHIRLNEPEKARACLRDIGASAPAEVQATAKVQLGRLAEAENNYAEAVACYEAAVQNPALPAAERDATRYLLGVNLIRDKRPAQAVPHLEQAAKGAGPTALGAAVRLAELLLRDPAYRGNRSAAVDQLAAAGRALGAGAEYPADALPIEEARAAFEEAIQVGVNEKDFASAVRAAGAYSPVAAPGRATEKRAEANTAWGNSLRDDPATAARAAEKFREAATDYAALAGTFPTAGGQADLLKRAANCFRLAGDDKAAGAVVEQLMRTPGVSDDVIAAACVEKADGLLAGNQFAEGVGALRQAMARATPAAATARVKLGLAHLDQARLKLKTATTEAGQEEVRGLMQVARDTLGAAVNAPAETAVEKDAQQTAMFELGKLHINQMELTEAETRFRQLLQAYPAGPQAGGGKLYLASCLLLMARGSHQGGRAPADADAKLAEAHKVFEDLSDSADPFLRTQADIRLANTMVLLRKYDKMPELCDKLSKRYAGKVEELIIQSMLYTAYHFADRLEPAAGVRAKMLELYQKLPETAYPGGAEEYTREYWQREWFAPLKVK